VDRREAMTGSRPLGPLVQSFFLDHLITAKGLRPASVRSYRDTIRLLLLCFVADNEGTKITKLNIEDLSFQRILGFLRHLEHDRANHVRTRNQRLAALYTLFEYIATREPQMLGVCQQVAAIPTKRAAPAETHFLERDEIETLLQHLPRTGRFALRDRALLLLLYNTGARVQEIADLRAGHLNLDEGAVAHLHGKPAASSACTQVPRSVSIPIRTRPAASTGSRSAHEAGMCSAISACSRLMPSRPSGSRARASRRPSSARSSTSW
jgi:integrase/recombinase XerD